MLQPILEFKNFKGINNVADPARIPALVADTITGRVFYNALVSATDCDIDATGMLSLKRDGRTKRATLTKGHSGWANQDGSLCFYVDNGSLKMLNADYTASVLKSGLSDNKMAFCENAGAFFCTNGNLTGFIENFVFNDFKDTFKPYEIDKKTMEVDTGVSYESSKYVDGKADYAKTPPPAGHLIEFFAGRLLIAKGNNIFFSDGLWVDQFDKRKNFLPFVGTITMMKPVMDGLWVSDGKGIYWISEEGFGETSTLNTVAEYGAFLDTATPHLVDSSMVGMDGLIGNGRLVSTPSGICWCGQGGQFVNLTQKHYIPNSESSSGAAIFKEQTGNNQYISITNK